MVLEDLRATVGRARKRASWKPVQRISLLLCGLASAVTPAAATETTTFTYDALGRLTQSSNAGGPRSGLSDSTAYDPAGNRTASAIGTALPNNAVLSISAPPAVNEGQAAVFTITKAGNASTTVTVNYATGNLTAIAPGDYTANSGTLSFAPAETVKTVPVPTIDDGLGEGAETFKMTLTSPTNATLGTSSATATINASLPANHPPVANDDMGSGFVCTGGPTIDVLSNDTDPDGDALTLVSVMSSSAMTVSLSLPNSVHAHNSSGATGNMDAQYVIQDSRGATATGILTITWNDNGGCL